MRDSILLLLCLNCIILSSNSFLFKTFNKLSSNRLSNLHFQYYNNRLEATKKSTSSEKESSPGSLDGEAKLEALSGVLYQIERAYGRGSIQKLGETPRMLVETSSSGSMTLDIALGGGYPKGRVIEIYGPESSGKTTLALHAIAEVQAMGGSAAFIDAEHALDPVYARNLGVDVDNLLVCQPDSGEMALDVVDQLVRSGALDLVVIDSVAALVPRAELEGDMTEQQMGLQARLMSKALRKITGSLNRSKTGVIFINQLRSKIGVMYGNPEVTAGGNALKFYSSVRVDIRRREVLKENEGIMVKVKVVKNKVAPPFRVVEFDILFGSGIDKFGCLLDAAEACGEVDRKGSWYSRGDLRFAQGRRPAIEFLKSNTDLADEIEKNVREILREKMAGYTPANVEEAQEAEAETPIE